MHVHPQARQVDEATPRLRRRNESRHTFRTILTLAILIAVMFGILMIVYIVRQNSVSNAKETSEGEKETIRTDHEKTIFDSCIDILWENLLRLDFNQSNPEHLQPIRIKVFNTLRRLSPKYKHDLILFLYEQGLIRIDIPFEQRLNLHGADLNHIEFKNINLVYLYLSGVIASNSLFSHCQLKHANFQGSMMDRSRFVACSLDKSTFSDASLKNTTFTNENSLIDIDFTNTDLFGSYIDITALNSTTITVNTRFPDGSFQNINSKELVNDGGAEQQCNTSQNTHWWSEDGFPSLETAHRPTNSCIRLPSIRGNNCYFQAESTSRLIQTIDLNHYSTLVDNYQTLYNVSAYMGCNGSSTDSATIELRFGNERKNYEHNPKHVFTKGKSFGLVWNSSLIPTGVRTVRIMIGANIRNSPACCAIDDVSFKILQ